MNVVDYLRKFLTEQPGREAAVPGLGVFYTEQQNGRNKILFKEVLPTDKAFLNYFAFEENLTEEEARAELEKWVRKVLQELKAAGSVTIAEVGSFSIANDKVIFKSQADEASGVEDSNFGLEQPVPQVQTPELPKEERPLRPPVPVEKARGKHAPRPIGKPKLQPAAQPGTAGKEIVLGTRKSSTPSTSLPVYARTWFIALCVLVVVCAVVFGITPVRKAVLGLAKKPNLEMKVPEDDMVEAFVDQMMEDEMEPVVADEAEMAAREKAVVEENAKVAQAVKAGETRKKEQEAQVRKMQAESKSDPASKKEVKKDPVKKVESSPQKQPAEKKVSQAVVQTVEEAKTPESGKFYIIVGSFASEANADRMAKKMCAEGLVSTVFYIEAKNLFYVSVKTCSTRDEAVGERTALRDRNIDCWIFAN